MITILDLEGSSAIVRKLPDIPVGEASRLADTRLGQRDGSGIEIDANLRGAGDIIENTRRYNGRVDGVYLSKSSSRGSKADQSCPTGVTF